MPKKYLILTLMLIAAFVAISVHAQVQEGDVVLSLSPQFPGANQNVTATLSSFSTNLDKAYITWSVNNQEINWGIGKKVFAFTTDRGNSTLNLSAAIETIDGQSIQKTAVIIPTNVDMLWEAPDSYTPPFYRGKALAGSQGTFKVVAMPNITNQNGKVSVNNLSYVWTKDGDVQTDSSGWGKNYLIFQNSYLDKGNTVGVKASDITGGANASGTLQLQTSTQKIVFYRNDPVLGMQWENVVTDGYRVNPDGETFVAEPYFFSPKNINASELALTWSLNGEQIQTPTPKNTLSVKPEGGQTGTAVIKVIANNINTLFQTREKQITIEF